MQHVAVAVVSIDASTVDLAGESLVVEFEPEWHMNGLVEGNPDGEGVKIICGQEIGDIAVTVELWDGLPPLTADGWQDVAEISATWSSHTLNFGTTAAEEDASTLLLSGPGEYRLRVHGKNRDDGDPRSDGDPVEEYLIQMWLAPHSGPQSIKSTSDVAAAWREQN